MATGPQRIILLIEALSTITSVSSYYTFHPWVFNMDFLDLKMKG